MDPTSLAMGVNLPSTALIYVFDIIAVSGFLSLSAILMLVWNSPSIHRTPTWYCFIIYWMIYDLVPFLLLGQQTGDDPYYELCLLQASLKYAVPVLTSFASVSLVLQLFVSMSLGDDNLGTDNRIVYLLLAAPPCLAVIVFLEALMYGLENPKAVTRSPSGMICCFSDKVLLDISAILVASALTLLLIVQTCMLRSMHRRRNFRLSKMNAFRDTFRSLNITNIIRIALLCLTEIFSLVLSVALMLPQVKWSALSLARSDILVITRVTTGMDVLEKAKPGRAVCPLVDYC
ncbi:hypothetical protein VKT23_002922 [Stygiomarasmius scandens]|uniref:Uncharacterized protein n=1 Tax=Marasmiellus scandens TaxID=2682957 RepID=A0ABR1K208_9AGAR